MFTKAFAIGEGLMPDDKRLTRFFEIINLERGLLIASAALLIGVAPGGSSESSGDRSTLDISITNEPCVW
jgi:hypothetical protein